MYCNFINYIPGECKACETEARRKVIRAERCRSLLCNFEKGTYYFVMKNTKFDNFSIYTGNLCNWRTGGNPGLPQQMLDVFLAENPDFERLLKKEREKDLDTAANEG